MSEAESASPATQSDAKPGDANPDDPEFDRLPRRGRTRVRPIPSLVVLLLSLAILWQLRGDLRYALRPATPVELGDAAQISAPLVDDSYVTLSGIPDRRNSLYVELTNVKARQLLFRLLGTNSRILVRAIPRDGAELAERWTGRLRRFDAMSYSGSLRDYFAHSPEVRALGYLDLARLGQSLAGAKDGLYDRGGRAVTLAPATIVTVTINHDDQLLASMPKRRHPEARDARYELERSGMPVVEAAGDDPEYFDFAVSVGTVGRDAAMAKLEALGAEVRLRRTHSAARLDALKGDATGVDIDGKRVPWSAVESVSYEAPITIPADAFLLTEGEAPGARSWTIALAGLLLLFALYNSWSLVRSLRRPD